MPDVDILISNAMDHDMPQPPAELSPAQMAIEALIAQAERAMADVDEACSTLRVQLAANHWKMRALGSPLAALHPLAAEMHKRQAGLVVVALDNVLLKLDALENGETRAWRKARVKAVQLMLLAAETKVKRANRIRALQRVLGKRASPTAAPVKGNKKLEIVDPIDLSDARPQSTSSSSSSSRSRSRSRSPSPSRGAKATRRNSTRDDDDKDKERSDMATERTAQNVDVDDVLDQMEHSPRASSSPPKPQQPQLEPAPELRTDDNPYRTVLWVLHPRAAQAKARMTRKDVLAVSVPGAQTLQVRLDPRGYVMQHATHEVKQTRFGPCLVITCPKVQPKRHPMFVPRPAMGFF